MKPDIWITFTKSRPLAGCDIDFDGCEFYFCEAYIPVGGSNDLRNVFEEIIDKTRNGLLEKKFDLVDISMIIRFDPLQWEIIGDNGNDVHKFAKSAEDCKNIVFSGFRTEDIEMATKYKCTVSNFY